MTYYWLTFWIDLGLAPVYILFTAWCVFHWAQAFRKNKADWRFRVAAGGLVLGVASAILLGVFFVHLRTTGTLIAHGSILWIVYYSGEYSADAGFVLALAGRGGLRLSAMIVNLAMVFRWYGMMIVGLRSEAILSTAMYICVMAICCVWLLSRPRQCIPAASSEDCP
jgi:hypothetical protein